MTMRRISPETLTAERFAPFGDVIEAPGNVPGRLINDGNTQRFHDLAMLDLLAEGGRAVLSIFRTMPLPRPVRLLKMERHPLSSQAFFPVSGRPYLVVVAPKGDFDATRINVFLASPAQGVNYHAGTWHHYNLALDAPSDFLVIDRDGPGTNCDEVFLGGSEIVVAY